MFIPASRKSLTPADKKKTLRFGMKFLVVGIAILTYCLYQAAVHDLTFRMLEHEEWRQFGPLAVLGIVFSGIGGMLVAIASGLVKKSCPECGAVVPFEAVSCDQCEDGSESDRHQVNSSSNNGG